MISSSPPVTTTDVRCGRCGSAVTAEGDTCTHCLLTDLMGPEGEEIFSCDQMEAVPSLKSGGGFILGDEIGHGGMGQVFRAQQISPAREVAVKLLMPHLLSSAESRRRFLAEGAAMAELEHPGILPLYACGEEDGRPWIAMKLATGGSLSSQRAKWVGRWIEACKLVALLADAMQHAHARGLIHRDLKPANILLDEAGRPWVADFGLAKWRQSEGHFTLSQELMGTPAYMAPEVAAEGVKGATTASDIYGLGAILYELLTGQPPYIDKSPVEILRKLSSADPTPPRSVQPAVPRDLEVVCLRAMDREPGKRYETAALFAADLRRYLSGQPVLARPQSTREKFGRWVRQHPWPAGLAAALALVTGISGAMIVNQNKTLRSRNDALTNALAG